MRILTLRDEVKSKRSGRTSETIAEQQDEREGAILQSRSQSKFTKPDGARRGKEMIEVKKLRKEFPVQGKQLIAIRIAPTLLARLRRLAAKRSKPYQTLIHELLERAAPR